MRKLNARTPLPCGACTENSSVSVTLDSGSNCYGNSDDVNWSCGSLDKVDKGVDELFDDTLHLLLGDNSNASDDEGKVYTVVVVRSQGVDEDRVVVGKYRHAWIVGDVLEDEAVKKVAQIFVSVFQNGGKEEGSIRSEFMPVGADGKIVLSFNLLNADPHNRRYDWCASSMMSFCPINGHY